MSLLSKTATGPLGWIKEGTLDISLNVTLPKIENTTKHKEMEPEPHHPINKPTKHEEMDMVETEELLDTTADSERTNDGATLELRFDVMFNHLRASAPLYTPELSYLNNAVVHPILAYINSHNKHIPLSFEFQLDVTGLAGARSPGEAGMWDALSASVAEAFGRIVHDTQNTETLRSVANTLLKDCWTWLSGWVYSPSYVPV
jgi:distribution and morphology protein 31